MINTKSSYPFKYLQLRKNFDNIEALADSIKGWNVDFRQLDCGCSHIQANQVETPSVMISEGIFNRRLEQKGDSPPGTWTFAVLERNSPNIIWRGQVMSEQTIAVYPPGGEIDASSPPGFHVLTFSIPTNVFKGWASLCKVDDPSTLQPKYTLIHVTSSQLDAIRSAARKVLTAGNPKQLQDLEMIMDLPNMIMNILRTSSPIRNKLSVKKRTHLLLRMRAYIKDHLSEPISLADLCKVINVSPRTVQYIFMDRYGVSPTQYIKARRLNAVHRDLLHNNFYKRTIAHIASDWGFWHMGQFSADYRRFFKNLPSETLARQAR